MKQTATPALLEKFDSIFGDLTDGSIAPEVQKLVFCSLETYRNGPWFAECKTDGDEYTLGMIGKNGRREWSITIVGNSRAPEVRFNGVDEEEFLNLVA